MTYLAVDNHNMATVEHAKARLDVEALFDSVGPSYEDAFASNPGQLASIDWLMHRLPPNARVLDIGCGTGRPVCSALAAAGHSVVGVDISQAMIDAARQNVPAAEFKKADIKTYVPSDGSNTFDAITVYFSLIASITQQEIKDTFAKIYDWLKPGGYFMFVTVPDSGNNVEIDWMGRPIIVSSLSKDEALEALKALRFQVLQVEESKFFPLAVEAGICEEKDVEEEEHLFVYTRK